jgi:NitT/TauT family transport system substrate-binding protein
MMLAKKSKCVGSRAAAMLCAAFALLAAAAVHADTLAISEYAKITSTLPWAVAFKKGYLQEGGLNITDIVSSSGGGNGLRNLLASDMPAGNVGTATAIAAIQQGMDLRIVMCNADYIGDLAWATTTRSTARSLKDLAGKKIAYTSPRSTTEMVLRAAVANAGLTGKVELLAIGGLGPGLTALAQGAVDATPLIDPALTLQADKYRILFHGSDVFPKFAYSVIVATREFTERHPEQLRALLRARRRAVEFMEKNRDATALIYSQVFEIDLEDAKKLLPKYYAWGQWSHGEFSKEGLDAMSKGMLAVGIIKTPMDWSKVIDQSFLAPDQQRKLW